MRRTASILWRDQCRAIEHRRQFTLIDFSDPTGAGLGVAHDPVDRRRPRILQGDQIAFRGNGQRKSREILVVGRDSESTITLKLCPWKKNRLS